MSTEVNVAFEVRDMAIMKDTLKEMGIDFNEIGKDILEIRRSYNNTVINGNTGKISYDADRKAEIDNIKQRYTVAFYKDRALKEGMQLQETVNEQGEVVLTLTQG
jgi:hypothetical protein